MALSILARSEEYCDIPDQRVQIHLDDVPNNSVVDDIVAVNENIAERDDLPVVFNTLKQGGLISTNAAKRLTHDLELPLYSATKLLIGNIVIEVVTGNKRLDCLGGLQDVVQMGKRFILHTKRPFLP